MRSLFILCLSGVFFVLTAQGQMLDSGPALASGGRVELSLENALTNYGNASQRFYNSRASLSYISRMMEFQVYGAFNQEQSFLFAPDTYTIILPSGAQIGTGINRSPNPNRYAITNPIGVQAKVETPFFNIIPSLSLFTESEDIDKIQVKDLGESVYVIDWSAFHQDKNTIVAGIYAEGSVENVTLGAGLSNFSLVHSSKSDFRYGRKFRTTPYASLRWTALGGTTSLQSDFHQLSVGRTQTITTGGAWLMPDIVSLRYSRTLKDYSYQALRGAVHYRLSDLLTLSLGAEHAWNPGGQFTSMTFREWNAAASQSEFGRSLAEQLPHSSVSLEVSYTLGSMRKPFEIHVANTKLLQKNIYLSKYAYYAYNPVATVDLLNAGGVPRYVEVCARSKSKDILYRSPSIRIDANQMTSVPVYLFLGNKDIATASQFEQVDIIAENDGDSYHLTTLPITFYDYHSWDGNTWNLRHFLTPDNPTVVKFAKSKFASGLSSYAGSAAETTLVQQYVHLCDFLSQIGAGLRYVSDPTSTLYVDQVQYPTETLEQKTGDCEDLAVFVASNLMAIGMHCAFVDIKPIQTVDYPTAKAGSLGHIFLLVDTGIEIDHVAQLGLSDAQIIVRKNVFNKNTIWIPLETTTLSSGFAKAFHDGVSLYYDEVVVKNGLVNGSIHVYDVE